MKNLLITLLLLLSFRLQAQTFSGRVIDSQTNQPIGFTSIGILHRDAGTVANEQGYFNLNPGKATSTDTLKISMIGYESVQFQVGQFERMLLQRNGVIAL